MVSASSVNRVGSERCDAAAAPQARGFRFPVVRVHEAVDMPRAAASKRTVSAVLTNRTRVVL
ncbi:hypothetical protein MPEAHAMD_6215 [Methylobacterium frigidaeris]|uniref:Uncharacterized protein n=1 Tax=Methylobacterium frigidaeris TaxID=2038277 RepID=A0AA37HI49_9HYPH|nr:hypothetical protein MPEAHAMD_6215 [Methylobacterium frigidaeris]